MLCYYLSFHAFSKIRRVERAPDGQILRKGFKLKRVNKKEQVKAVNVVESADNTFQEVKHLMKGHALDGLTSVGGWLVY